MRTTAPPPGPHPPVRPCLQRSDGMPRYTALYCCVHKRNAGDWERDGNINYQDVFPLPIRLACRATAEETADPGDAVDRSRPPSSLSSPLSPFLLTPAPRSLLTPLPSPQVHCDAGRGAGEAGVVHAPQAHGRRPRHPAQGPHAPGSRRKGGGQTPPRTRSLLTRPPHPKPQAHPHPCAARVHVPRHPPPTQPHHIDTSECVCP